MFNKLFGSKKKKEQLGTFIVIQLNDKIMPIARGEFYEDPLEELLESKQYGEITGGGTMQHESGGIKFCDIEVLLYQGEHHRKAIEEIVMNLEEIGAPKGSHITIGDSDEPIHFGKKEGLAIYLDGVNLPENIYAECDINVVLSELSRLVGYDGDVQRYWEGNTETALYFYGDSFETMKSAIMEFVSTYPLCQNARIVQIA